MDDSQSLKDSQTRSNSDHKQRKEFGERVDVLPGGTETPIGTYDCATTSGDIYAGTIVEVESTSTMSGINALSYKFSKSETKGKFPIPTAWYRLLALSVAGLITVTILDLILGVVDLNGPAWNYILPLFVFSIVSAVAIVKRMKKFAELVIMGVELEKLANTYKKPVLDLPVGRLKEVRESINSTLSVLSKIEHK